MVNMQDFRHFRYWSRDYGRDTMTLFLDSYIIAPLQ